MSYDTGEPAERNASRWANALSVPALLLIAWVLYELTSQPALAVATICLKFGWDDARTAWWLRQRDVNRRRGRALFWLYLAFGLWKVAITASLMIFAYIFLRFMGWLGGGVGRQVVGALIAAFVGIFLSALLTCWSVFLAWKHRLKLWLHHRLHQARRQNAWPPPRWATGDRNFAGTLLGTTLFASGLPVLLIALLAALGPLQPGNPAVKLVLLGFHVGCLLLAGLLFRLERGAAGRRVFARMPGECWQQIKAEDVRSSAATAVQYASDEIQASRAASWGQREAPSY
jgi:fumarate reductase subunit D